MGLHFQAIVRTKTTNHIEHSYFLSDIHYPIPHNYTVITIRPIVCAPNKITSYVVVIGGWRSVCDDVKVHLLWCVFLPWLVSKISVMPLFECTYLCFNDTSHYSHTMRFVHLVLLEGLPICALYLYFVYKCSGLDTKLTLAFVELHRPSHDTASSF
eukprot:441754_1